MFELEDHYWWFVGRRRLALSLLRHAVGERSDSPKVLDLGCGTGVVLRDLGEWATPIGLDMSPLALGFCQQRGMKQLVQGNGEKLPLADGSVDAMIALDIFEHIPDDSAAFAESFRVLKSGGVLTLSVPAFRFLWGPHDIALMHMRRYRGGEIRQRLEEAGFVVERLSYSVFFLFPILVIWRMFEKLKPGPPEASLVRLPHWANQLLTSLQDLEAATIAARDLPWGSSVVAVARKP